jgi:uncharacterized membrane-anchored protein
MRKRSKYRPKGVRLDTMAYIKESMTPIAHHGDYLMTLKIKNHAALAALTQGRATRADIDTLIATVNVCEALYRMGIGREYADVVRDGLDALRAVASRGAANNRFILRASEMEALNTVMELHDAQLDMCVVKDIERATEIVRIEQQSGRATKIVTNKEGQ